MDPNALLNGRDLFREADRLLELGRHELERAEEDVVIPMVCFKTRQSVANYLHGFLLDHDIQPLHPFTLDHLHKQCVRIWPAFQQVILQSFECRYEDDDESYCMEVHKVEECMKAALEIQKIIQAAG